MTTLDRLAELIVRDYKIDAATLTPETPFEALGIDSLGMAELLFNVEDEFAIKLPSEPVALPTIADAVGYIDELIEAQHPADATESAIAHDAAKASSPGA